MTTAFGIDEFFRVSHCNVAKKMRVTLKITYEGKIDVKKG